MSQIALVTGTRKGIGFEIAQHLLAQGWTVIGCSRKKGTIVSPNYKHYELDVSDEPAVVSMVKQIKREFGPIYALINNAGTASMNHLLLTPGKSYRTIFDTNVFGTFLLLRECAKQMSRQKQGRIINFSSVANPLNLDGEALYAASKSAVESLTKISAKELGPYGITVNAIGPTPIETDLIKLVPKESIQGLIQKQALPRLGEYKDVLNCIDFYLKEESNFITGQTLYLGGVF